MSPKHRSMKNNLGKTHILNLNAWLPGVQPQFAVLTLRKYPPRHHEKNSSTRLAIVCKGFLGTARIVQIYKMSLTACAQLLCFNYLVEFHKSLSLTENSIPKASILPKA